MQSSLKKISKATAKMGSATFLSRILGLVREQAMASVFGASGLTDAFLVAYRVPNLLRDLFAEGAFSSAFVPVFTEVLQKGEKEARKLLWSLCVILLVITGIITLMIMIMAPELVLLFTDQAYKLDREKFELTVVLVRIMAPFLTLVSLAALFMGVLNSLKIFFIPSLAPAFFNVVMIASIFFLPALMQERGMHPILSLGVGVVCGGLIQLAVQIPLVLKNNFGPMGPLQFFSQHTRKIINRVGVGTIGIAANQINLLVNTILATGTVVGAVSWLAYAFRLFQFPVGILSVSLAGSNLVHFSEAWKKGETKLAVETLKVSYTLSWYAIAPAFALLYALGEESVHLIFEHGLFTREDTTMAALALKFYLFGLPFYGIYKILTPVFFSIDRPKVPVFLSVVSIGINIIFCVSLVDEFGFKILALGTGLSMLFNTIGQSVYLKNFLKLPWSFYINKKIVKVLVAGGATLWFTRYLSSQFFSYQDPFIKKVSIFCTIGCGGALTYLLALAVLGEWIQVKKLVKRD